MQAAHEAARRAQCTNNLKQLALAIHNYISTYEAVPPSGNAGDQNATVQGSRLPNVQNGSMKSRLLPYLEQQAVYNAINWSLPQFWDGGLGLPGTQVNATATAAMINAFLCPTDGNACNNDTNGGWNGNIVQHVGGYSNYPNNLGYNRSGVNPTGGQAWRPNGPAYFLGDDTSLNIPVNMASITDGTSGTMIFSEYVKGTAGDYKDQLGATYTGNWDYNLGDHWNANPPAGQNPQYVSMQAYDVIQCQTATSYQWDYKGEYWICQDSGRGGGFSSVMTPNKKACNAGSQIDWWCGVGFEAPRRCQCGVSRQGPSGSSRPRSIK